MSLEKELRSITPEEAEAALLRFTDKALQSDGVFSAKDGQEARVGLAHLSRRAFMIYESKMPMTPDEQQANLAFIGFFIGGLLEIASLREVNELLGFDPTTTE